jgi:hypothetical protein
MNAPLSRRDARIANRNAEQLASIGPLRRARSPKKGNVLIAALTEDSIRGRGKVEPPPCFFRISAAVWHNWDTRHTLFSTRRICLRNLGKKTAASFISIMKNAKFRMMTTSQKQTATSVTFSTILRRAGSSEIRFKRTNSSAKRA